MNLRDLGPSPVSAATLQCPGLPRIQFPNSILRELAWKVTHWAKIL